MAIMTKTLQESTVSEQEKRMRSALYLVLDDLREQADSRTNRFTFDGNEAELRDIIGQLEFSLLPDSVAIEGQREMSPAAYVQTQLERHE